METQAPTRKIRLRRLNTNNSTTIELQDAPNEDVIQQNLAPLKPISHAKLLAQERYYESNNTISGMSPMTRDRNRRPVKQRLGRRIPFTGTNAASIPPKFRLRRINSTMHNPIYTRKNRNYSAQHRLNRIRAQNLQNINSPHKIRLRRTFPNNGFNAARIRVEVKNPNALMNRSHLNGHQPFIYRFKQILNPKCQTEIKQIKRDFVGGPKIIFDPIVPAVTGVSINDRFASLT